MSKYAGRIQKYVNVDSIDTGLDGFDIVQPKHDGWWARVVIDGKSAAVYSRQAQLKTRKPVNRGCPQMTIIGEYCFGTNRTKSGVEVEENVVAFDIVELDGKTVAETLTYGRRLDLIDHLSHYADWLVPVLSRPVAASQRLWDTAVLREGCEGLIFRNSHDTYSDAVIGRLKREFTMDYVVLGLEEGKGKLTGMAGVMVCGLFMGGKLTEACRVGGGMDNAMRKRIWRTPGEVVGKVIEVRGWQLFSTGALRHPQFVRVRDDKKPRECVWAGGAE